MSRHRPTRFQRVLRRMLVRGRGEVRAMEDAAHLEGILRFAGLFVVTILLPTSLLAYFGVVSLGTEEASVRADLQRAANITADTYWSAVDREFSRLEERIGARLISGRSPLDLPRELHPHMVAALRFDESGQLEAPFVIETATDGVPAIALFHPLIRAAEEAERSDAPAAEVAALYAQAALEVPWPAVRSRLQFDQARMLSKAGETEAAVDLFDRLIAGTPSQRDPWGFRVVDLARLARGELFLDSPDRKRVRQGRNDLRALVESLLSARWVVGQGGEAAVVRYALSVLEPEGTSADWIATTRGRADERTSSLFWTGELLAEVGAIVGQAGRNRRTDGDLGWVDGERAIWVSTWWGDDLYVFALDRERVVSELKANARASVLADSDVSAYLIAPNEPLGSELLVSKPLAPWLTGWSIVVEPHDPEAIVSLRDQRRRRRVIIILLAVGMIGVGTIITTRLIKRELDGARMQADFAASVSHELRSPITHIRVQGESLMFDLMDTDDEREEAYVSIVRESERLSRLVDNVLDFAAIERGAKRYALRPDNLAETVMRAINSISSAQEVRDKDLDVDLPIDLPTVHLDADAVAQCVINLVSNAAKYSAPGGWIGVRGRVVESGVEITISDKGIGIAPHDLRMIFEPFFRSRDALARRRKGTGIGLAITRYIMRAHGGDVSVQSRPGKGSTFTLRFPLQPAESLPARSGLR